MRDDLRPQRYQAAWGEIGARLQSRQTVGVVYLTASITLLSLAIGSPSLSQPYYTWRLPFVILLPVLSFAVSKWLRHSDAIIGLLSAYCAALEDPSEHAEIPAWHSPKHGFIGRALEHRVWADHAAVVVTTVATLPAALHTTVGLGMKVGELAPMLAWFPASSAIASEAASWPTLLLCAASTAAGIAALAVLLGNVILRGEYLRSYAFQSRPGPLGVGKVWGYFPTESAARPAVPHFMIRWLRSFWLGSGASSEPEGYPDRDAQGAQELAGLAKSRAAAEL